MQILSAMIAAFLKKFKKVATEGGRGIEFVPRYEHKDALLELGLTMRDREDAVMSLSVSDYCNGPEADEVTIPGEIWFFGKTIGKPVYIKLKIATVDGVDGVDGVEIAKCLAFHPAKHTLRYPLK